MHFFIYVLGEWGKMGHPRMLEEKQQDRRNASVIGGEEKEYRYKNNKGCIPIHPLLFFMCYLYNLHMEVISQ